MYQGFVFEAVIVPYSLIAIIPTEMHDREGNVGLTKFLKK